MADSSSVNPDTENDWRSRVCDWASPYVRGSNPTVEYILFGECNVFDFSSLKRTTADDVEHVRPWIEARISEECASIDARYLEAVTGPPELGTEEVNKIYLGAELDRLDTIFRYYSGLVPLIWTRKEFIDFMQRKAKDFGQLLSERGIASSEVSWCLRDCIQSWEVEALRLYRGLELSGYLRAPDEIVEKTSIITQSRIDRRRSMERELASIGLRAVPSTPEPEPHMLMSVINVDERRAAIDTFLQRCNDGVARGENIIRTDIADDVPCTPRTVQMWQAGSASQRIDRRIRAVLSDPVAFVARFNAKRSV